MPGLMVFSRLPARPVPLLNAYGTLKNEEGIRILLSSKAFLYLAASGILFRMRFWMGFSFLCVCSPGHMRYFPE